jgi:hypothetical protein
VASTEDSRTRRRWLVWGLVAVAVVLVGAWFVRSVVLRDRARAVTTEEAVGEFRMATTTVAPAAGTAATATSTPFTTATTATGGTEESSPPSSALPTDSPRPPSATPEPGVYRYRTTGREDIDALGGTGHTYPDETTITVIEADCGVTLRWDALRERRDEWGLCAVADGIELHPTSVQFHEFYGQSEEELVVCDVPVLVVPTDAAVREPATQSCMLAADPWFPVWEVLEATTRTVGDTVIDVMHVRTTIVDEDEFWEQAVTDWYLAPSGLPVEVISTKSSLSPSIVGPVLYDEQFHLELLSIEPLR